ncbi:hypothetical protein ACLB1N_28070 [Escherichia coli]
MAAIMSTINAQLLQVLTIIKDLIRISVRIKCKTRRV